jgi:hypothetical protein
MDSQTIADLHAEMAQIPFVTPKNTMMCLPSKKCLAIICHLISPETRMYPAPEQGTGQISGQMNYFCLLFVYLTDTYFISIQLKDFFKIFVFSSNNKQKLFICQTIC